MDAKHSSDIIEAAGGSAAFARLVGYDPAVRGVIQRVNNWKTRGIPSSVAFENVDAIRRLESSMSLNGQEDQAA